MFLDIYFNHKKYIKIIMGICESDKNSKQSHNNFSNNQIENNILQGLGNIQKQAFISGKSAPSSIENEIKINEQMKNFICKIIINNKYGTGFICKIPFPNELIFLPVLIMNKSIINKDELQRFKKLEISFDNDREEKIINITPERKIYSSQKYDITFIEIIPEIDGINKYLETNILDKSNIDNLNTNYEKESKNMSYVLQYQNGINCIESHGIINKIEGDIISHNCAKDIGGPILLFKDQKIIGINIGNGQGILLGKSIEEFYTFVTNNKISDKTIKNCIDCYYIINNGDYFNLLFDFDESHNIQIKEYIEGRKKKKFLEENINIYVDSQPIKFSYKYKSNNNQIHVKFIFKQILNDLSFLFTFCKNLETIDLYSYDTTHITNMLGMFYGCENLKSVNLSNFKSTNDINMGHMFRDCNKLKTINFPSNNYPKITPNNVEDLFLLCSSLESLDLSSFNTIKVKSMDNLFNGCSSLNSLNLSSFNTSNVVNMERMFCVCMNLKSLDLSKFNTEKVEKMNDMFFDCRSLITLDLSSFNTSNVKHMEDMFMNCYSLKVINLSSFNTINVVDMNDMFAGCSSLQSIDLSSFNTINVMNMHGMFLACNSLKSLNLSCFKTPKLENLDVMFLECGQLEHLDLSSFNTMNVNKENSIANNQMLVTSLPDPSLAFFYKNIFFGCFNLKTLNCSDNYLLKMFNQIKEFNINVMKNK